jgi:hypothetical protein
MADNNPFKRNKILDMLQGSANQSSAQATPRPATSSDQNAEQFIYPNINELDRVLRRFKERHSVTNPGPNTAENSL